MSYYKVLGLEREPFSTSPDPDFFYHSPTHETALKRLEISLRLRRGLNIIFGDVGTGKTTLLRTLLQSFKDENDFIFHMMLDPAHKSEFQFLGSLIKMFGIKPAFNSTMDFKEELEKYLYQKGVEENKTIVLLVDEGQKISTNNLEVLRTLLNYETNEYKLLQLVIMSQMEMLGRIKRIRNFSDRIALKYTINPLDEIETRKMIDFRLQQAGHKGLRSLFTEEAVRLICEAALGYPRRISMLCHASLEAAVMKDRPGVDKEIVLGLLKEDQ